MTTHMTTDDQRVLHERKQAREKRFMKRWIAWKKSEQKREAKERKNATRH